MAWVGVISRQWQFAEQANGGQQDLPGWPNDPKQCLHAGSRGTAGGGLAGWLTAHGAPGWIAGLRG